MSFLAYNLILSKVHRQGIHRWNNACRQCRYWSSRGHECCKSGWGISVYDVW